MRSRPMSEHPLYDLLERDFGPRFDESPWSPEFLEEPWPASITAALDLLKRKTVNMGDTQYMEIITCEVAPACPVHGGEVSDEPAGD